LFLSPAIWLSTATVVADDEENGCEFGERTKDDKALSEYLRVARFDESLIVDGSSDVNSGV